MVGLEQVADGLSSPMMGVAPDDGSGHRFIIVDQVGLIRILLPDGRLFAEPFLDVQGRFVPLNRR